MQVPGGATHHVAGGVTRQGDGLFDALVLGAVGKGECAGGGGALWCCCRHANVAVLELSRHIEAGVAFPAHRVFAAGVVVADGLEQVAFAHGHAAVGLGACTVVVKHIVQLTGAPERLRA